MAMVDSYIEGTIPLTIENIWSILEIKEDVTPPAQCVLDGRGEEVQAWF